MGTVLDYPFLFLDIDCANLGLLSDILTHRVMQEPGF